MALLSTAKPAKLSPQSSTVVCPSETEQQRAGVRAVVPEAGSLEARRRARAESRNASPNPSPPLVAPSLELSMSSFSSASSSSASSLCSTVVVQLEDRRAALPKDLWKEDANADECDREGCHVRFGTFARRHHCRKCGLVFCSECSSMTFPLLYPNLPARTSLSRSSSISSTQSSSNAAASSSSSSAPPTAQPSGSISNTATSSSSSSSSSTTSPPAPTHPVPSRVCVDCHRFLTAPPPSRPSLSRRSSSCRTTTASSSSTSPSVALVASPSSPPLANASMTSGAGSGGCRQRSSPPSRNSSHVSLAAAFAAGGSSTALRSPGLYEPWMDGPLAEFPLAYPRREARGVWQAPSIKRASSVLVRGEEHDESESAASTSGISQRMSTSPRSPSEDYPVGEDDIPRGRVLALADRRDGAYVAATHANGNPELATF